jgi:hypothetical protein
MKDIQRLLAMPDEQRRRLRLLRSSRRRKNRCELGLHFTRDELLEYLRRKNFRTRKQLRDGRQKGEPRDCDYIREFKKWKTAVVAALGRKETSPTDASYFVKVVVQFNLWTKKRYLTARRREPDLVPSAYWLKKRWGNFGNLIACARQYDESVIIGDYLKLYRKLGRIPTDRECRANGVNIDKVVALSGSRKKFDSHIGDIIAVEEGCAAKRRSS